MQRMLDDGIATRRGVMNAHTRGGLSRGHLARRRHSSRRAKRAQRRHAMVLPLFHQMTDRGAGSVVASLARPLAGLTRDLSILTPAFNEAANLGRCTRG